MNSTITPKIILNFDRNHQDPFERKLDHKLSEIDPQAKIIYFRENRTVEQANINLDFVQV